MREFNVRNETVICRLDESARGMSIDDLLKRAGNGLLYPSSFIKRESISVLKLSCDGCRRY